MNFEDIKYKMNEWGTQKVPFFFMINFLKTEGEIYRLDELPPTIQYEFESKNSAKTKEISLEKFPVSFEDYQLKFDPIFNALHRGDTYLINLTQPTKIKTEANLQTIFEHSKAKFKLLTPDFVSFSPERFIKIENQKIYSYPMKGTIDANIENAENIILNDEKETAEHATIVDLIRNDLSMVAENVNVKKYRYTDKISSNNANLLQISSEIEGDLPPGFHTKLGDIFDTLLPAGSICGAPKKKTVELILEHEKYDRSYYTGIFGVFDGENLDSAVLIRFIEKINDELYYKSGGGITHKSDVKSEYNELIQKIYVPIC